MAVHCTTLGLTIEIYSMLQVRVKATHHQEGWILQLFNIIKERTLQRKEKISFVMTSKIPFVNKIEFKLQDEMSAEFRQNESS